MIVIESFDVNKHGVEVDEIKGVVAGGSILRVLFISDYPINLFILVNVLCVFCTFPQHVLVLPMRYQREIIIVSSDFYVYYFVGCVESV